MCGTPENITLMAGTHVEFVSEIPDQRPNTAGNKMQVGAILWCILIMKRYFQGNTVSGNLLIIRYYALCFLHCKDAGKCEDRVYYFTTAFNVNISRSPLPGAEH